MYIILIAIVIILYFFYEPLSDVSRSSDVSISIYLRPSPETKNTISNNHSTTTKHADYFLGGVKLQPNFDSTRLDDQVLQIAGGTGMMHVQLCYKPQQVKFLKKKMSKSKGNESSYLLYFILYSKHNPLPLTRLTFYE